MVNWLKMPQVVDPDGQDPAVPASRGPVDDGGSSQLRWATAAAAGDNAAGRALVDSLQPSLARVALAMTGNVHDAEEVVQEALLRVVRNIGQFRGQAKITTWAHRILVNVALMRVRAQSRRPWDAVRAFGRSWEHGDADGAYDHDGASVLDGQVMGAVSAWAERPDHGAQGQQLREKISAALAALPERYRMVFVLRDVEGHSNEEVAEMLGLTGPTVKTRLHRARGFMRQHLASELGADGQP